MECSGRGMRHLGIPQAANGDAEAPPAAASIPSHALCYVDDFHVCAAASILFSVNDSATVSCEFSYI
jgi:hypothetical protein